MEKKLKRSEEDCMLFGVCGGIAEYFDCDSTIIRLIAIFSGVGLFTYLIAALLIPSE